MLFLLVLSTFIPFAHFLPIVEDSYSNDDFKAYDWTNICRPLRWNIRYQPEHHKISANVQIFRPEQIICYKHINFLLNVNGITIESAKLFTLHSRMNYTYNFYDIKPCTSYEILLVPCVNKTYCVHPSYTKTIQTEQDNCTDILNLDDSKKADVYISAAYNLKFNYISTYFKLNNSEHQYCFKNYKLILKSGNELIRMKNINAQPNNTLNFFRFNNLIPCKSYDIFIKPCFNLTHCSDNWTKYQNRINSFDDSCISENKVKICEKYKLTTNITYHSFDYSLIVNFNVSECKFENCFERYYVFLKSDNSLYGQVKNKANDENINQFTFNYVVSCSFEIMILPCYNSISCAQKIYMGRKSMNVTQETCETNELQEIITSKINLHEVTTPKMNIIKKITPTVGIIEETTQKMGIIEETTQKMDIIEETTPKMDIIEETTPKMDIIEETTPKMDIIEETTQKININEETTPKININEESTPKININEESTPKININEEIIPKITMNILFNDIQKLNNETRNMYNALKHNLSSDEVINR